MNIANILVTCYLFLGLVLALYWMDNDYAKSHEQAVKDGVEEKGMTSIFLLILMFLWPIKLIKNIIKKKRI